MKNEPFKDVQINPEPKDGSLKVELGCGTSKTEGYVGVDRFQLPGVDIVADLNQPFPFDDSSIDVIWACHSLEHLNNMYHVISEMYRVCKHGALIYILAPYHNTSLNIANFYHHLVFNEHTFQFFSNERDTVLGIENYYCPHAPMWGLASSDNSTSEIELIPLTMDLMYYPAYAALPEDEKTRARRAFDNVCDQIFYALGVNKRRDSFTQSELNELQTKAKELEPGVIDYLRNRPIDPANTQSVFTDIERRSLKHLSTLEDNLRSNIHQKQEESSRLFNELQQIQAKQAQSYTDLIEQTNQAFALTQDTLMALRREQDTQAQKQSSIENSLDHHQEDLRRMHRELSKNTEQKLAYHDQCVSALQQIQARLLQEQSAAQHQKDAMADNVLNYLQSREDARFRLRRNTNISWMIRTGYGHFWNTLLLQTNAVNRRILLTFSSAIPYKAYYEYHLMGRGESIAFFAIASTGAHLLVEIVRDGNIVKQGIIQIQNDGMQTLALGSHYTNAMVRFRSLTPNSVIRTLELYTKTLGIPSKRKLAAWFQ